MVTVYISERFMCVEIKVYFFPYYYPRTMRHSVMPLRTGMTTTSATQMCIDPEPGVHQAVTQLPSTQTSEENLPGQRETFIISY